MTLEKKEYLFLGNWMELRLATETFGRTKAYLLRSGQRTKSSDKGKEKAECVSEVFTDTKSASA